MPRAGLDAARVTTAAAAIVDSEGTSALTLARLAGNLGVATPSLYKHVGGLNDLLARVATLATNQLADALTTASVGRSGRTALVEIANAYRRFALDHPGLYPLAQEAPAPGQQLQQAAAARAVTIMNAALVGYGIAEEIEIDAVRMVRAGLHGFVDLERRGGFGLPRSIDTSFTILVDALDAALLSLATGATTPDSPTTTAPSTS